MDEHADEENELEVWMKECQDEIDASRETVQSDPNNDTAWCNLGIQLGAKASAQAPASQSSILRQQAIDSFREAIRANPNNSDAWFNLGEQLYVVADEQGDLSQATELREQVIDAYRKAVRAKPDYHQAWFSPRHSIGCACG